MIDIICYFTSKLPFVAVRFRDILKSVAFSRMSLLDWTSEEEEFSESYDEDSGDISVFYFFQFLCLSAFCAAAVNRIYYHHSGCY